MSTAAKLHFTRPDARNLSAEYKATYRDADTDRVLAYVDLLPGHRTVMVTLGPEMITSGPWPLKAGAVIVRSNLHGKGYDRLVRS